MPLRWARRSGIAACRVLTYGEQLIQLTGQTAIRSVETNTQYHTLVRQHLTSGNDVPRTHITVSSQLASPAGKYTAYLCCAMLSKNWNTSNQETVVTVSLTHEASQTTPHSTNPERHHSNLNTIHYAALQYHISNMMSQPSCEPTPVVWLLMGLADTAATKLLASFGNQR